MGDLTHNLAPKKAWVVFYDQADWLPLRFLRPKFRHCMVVLNDGASWIFFDPLLNKTEIFTYPVTEDNNPPAWYEKEGHTVVPALILEAPYKPAPLALLTCVEQVKRVLGIRARMVITPYQLYKHLRKLENESTQGS